MRWEYEQLLVGVKGLFNPKLDQRLVPELNELAREGWAVDHVIGLQIGAGTTAAVVFLLKRERQ